LSRCVPCQDQTVGDDGALGDPHRHVSCDEGEGAALLKLRIPLNETVQVLKCRPLGQISLHAKADIGHMVALRKDPGIASGGELCAKIVVAAFGIHVDACQ
jgi:hypothetical protein